jgi:hypothetical protein
MVGILLTFKIQGGWKYFCVMMRRKMALFWREGDRERKLERERISPSGENLSKKERFSPKKEKVF